MSTTPTSMVESLAEKARDTVDEAEQRALNAQMRATATLETAVAYVREHPLASVGMALAAGYLFALLIRR